MLLTLAIVIPFSCECYISLQFTKTAGVLCATGIWGLFFALRYKGTKLSLFTSALLILTGSMLRFQSFLIVCAVMCITGLFVIIENNKNGEKKLKSLYENSKTYIWGFAIIFFLSFTLDAVDKAVYINHKYRQVGYTPEDIQMYSYWTFADPDKLSLDDMKQIYELNRTKKISGKMIADFLQDFPLKLIKMPLMPVVLIMIIYYLLFFRNKKYYVLCYLALVETLGYFYFYYKDRYDNVHRIDVVFLYAITCTMALLISWSSECNIKREPFILCVMGAASVGNIFFLSGNLPQQNITDVNPYVYQEFYDNLYADTSSLYLESTSSIFYMNAYEMWDVFPEGLSRNQYSLGNWLTNSPITNDILRRYDVRNPFRDLIDNPNVYLIDNYNIDMELSYIKRNYNKDAKAALVKSVHGFLVYKIYTEISDSYGMDLIKESKNIISDVQIGYDSKEKSMIVFGDLYKKM